jgi:hypothetical protein
MPVAFTYPNVACHLHGAAPGYSVCPHVLMGARVGEVRPPTDEQVGQIVCASGQCPALKRFVLSPATKLACPNCAKEKGWLERAGPVVPATPSGENSVSGAVRHFLTGPAGADLLRALVAAEVRRLKKEGRA